MECVVFGIWKYVYSFLINPYVSLGAGVAALLRVFVRMSLNKGHSTDTAFFLLTSHDCNHKYNSA